MCEKENVIDYSDCDIECMDLCKTMNLFPGIHTLSSCCGHGVRPFRVFFRVKKVEHLPHLLYWFDKCHCGFGGWRVEVNTDCAMNPATFVVEGPIGELAYKQSAVIVGLMSEWLNERGIVNGSESEIIAGLMSEWFNERGIVNGLYWGNNNNNGNTSY